MVEYIYLISNADLYYIGRTENLEQVKKSLVPGVIEACLETENAKTILKIIQSNYSDKRLPQSNYYRLTKEQSIECKERLEQGVEVNDFKPFFSGAKLVFSFIIIWIFLSMTIIIFGIQPIFDQFS